MLFQPCILPMNRWKVLALIMIGLLAGAVGLRFAYMEGHTFQLDENQKIFAVDAAKNELRDDISGNDFNVSVQQRGRIVSTGNENKKVVQVVLTHENTTLTALVDMDTGNVVEKGKIESTGWMVGYKDQGSKRWGHQRIFNR